MKSDNYAIRREPPEGSNAGALPLPPYKGGVTGVTPPICGRYPTLLVTAGNAGNALEVTMATTTRRPGTEPIITSTRRISTEW